MRASEYIEQRETEVRSYTFFIQIRNVQAARTHLVPFEFIVWEYCKGRKSSRQLVA